jgi:hypothetical protein
MTLQHSMVQSCSLDFCCKGLGDAGGYDIVEQAVLPPKRIDETSHGFLASGLIENLESLVFGMETREWLARLALSFAVFLVVCVSDSAAANILALSFFRVLMCVTICAQLKVLFWWEKCGLHQLGRIVVVVMSRVDLVKAAFSLTRVLQMRRPKEALRKGVNKFLGESLQFDPDVRAPAMTSATSPAYRRELKKLLLGDGGRFQEDKGKNARDAMEEYIDFFDGNLAVGQPGHYKCLCTPRCRTRAQAVQRSKVVTTNALFARTVPRFNIQRWRKQRPAVLWMAAFFCIHGIGARGLESPEFVDQVIVNAGLKAENANSEEVGARLRYILKWSQKELAAFDLLFILVIMNLLEPAVENLFQASDCVVPSTKADRHVKSKSGGPKPAQDDARGTSIEEVMDSISKLMVRLWEMYTQPWENGPLAVLLPYWPSRLPVSDMHRRVGTGLLTVMAQVEMRFLIRFSEPPYSLRGLENDPLVWDVVDEATTKFCAARKCDLNPDWAEGAQEVVLSLPPRLRGHALVQLRRGWAKAVRGTSLREEAEHTVQRNAAGGNKSAPTSFARQSSALVLDGVGRLWTACGGRDLATAPAIIKAKAKNVIVAIKAKASGAKPKIARPNNRGNPVIAYCNTNLDDELKHLPRKDPRKLARISELSDHFKSLGKPEQDRHMLSVRACSTYL